jgi:hypothetical protein
MTSLTGSHGFALFAGFRTVDRGRFKVQRSKFNVNGFRSIERWVLTVFHFIEQEIRVRFCCFYFDYRFT